MMNTHLVSPKTDGLSFRRQQPVVWSSPAPKRSSGARWGRTETGMAHARCKPKPKYLCTQFALLLWSSVTAGGKAGQGGAPLRSLHPSSAHDVSIQYTTATVATELITSARSGFGTRRKKSNDREGAQRIRAMLTSLWIRCNALHGPHWIAIVCSFTVCILCPFPRPHTMHHPGRWLLASDSQAKHCFRTSHLGRKKSVGHGVTCGIIAAKVKEAMCRFPHEPPTRSRAEWVQERLFPADRSLS